MLVTGASRGIGAAVAQAAARAGAETLLLARDVRALERLADGLEAEGAPAPVLIPCNLERAGADDYAQVATLVAERWGRLDGLVVNAALLGELAPLASHDPLLWARVFQVNVHSAFLLLQACLPLLGAATAPRLVFTLDLAAGVGGRPFWGAYGVSKQALRALFEVLAAEHRRGPLRINAVAPGPTRTRLRRQAFPAEDPRTCLAPEDVALAYLPLLGVDCQGHAGVIPVIPTTGAH